MNNKKYYSKTSYFMLYSEITISSSYINDYRDI